MSSHQSYLEEAQVGLQEQTGEAGGEASDIRLSHLQLADSRLAGEVHREEGAVRSPPLLVLGHHILLVGRGRRVAAVAGSQSGVEGPSLQVGLATLHDSLVVHHHTFSQSFRKPSSTKKRCAQGIQRKS